MDDIWDENLWEYLKCVFHKNNHGSRLITTTRKVSVSEACCPNGDSIFRMKPLSSDDSKRLFYKRIFRHEDRCPPELKEVSKDILKKCGGVPLAIITIASLLANKHNQIDQWHNVLSCIGRGVIEGHKVDDMKKILCFSYYDLPSHLKACLLCLSIFPEDYEIRRDHLVQMWIAEGVIQNIANQQENMLVELGESYFYELINRSMIQPGSTDDCDGSIVISCRVHDIILDVICSLAKRENFVTILGNERDASQVNKVHRLSLQNSKEVPSIPEGTMPKVRSLSLFSSSINMMPAVKNFPSLRVLYLDCQSVESNHIKHLGKLFHLRYLQLRCKSIDQLPKEIGNLQFLQSLDISGTSIEELPPDIVQLRRLRFLDFPKSLILSDWVGALTSLQQLSSISVSHDSLVFLKALGNLTELRHLNIVLLSNIWDVAKVLVESLCKLRKLCSLTLSSDDGRIFLESIEELWVPTLHLRALQIFYVIFPTLPAWFNSSFHLQHLSCLYIEIIEMRQDHVEKLGRLPVLCILQIQVSHARERLVIGANMFPSLKECKFMEDDFGLVFQRGAMPKVEKLKFVIVAQESKHINFDFGLGNLPSLEEVFIHLHCHKAQLWEVKLIETALKDVAKTHPMRPTLYVERRYEHDMVLADQEQQLPLFHPNLELDGSLEDSDFEGDEVHAEIADISVLTVGINLDKFGSIYSAYTSSVNTQAEAKANYMRMDPENREGHKLHYVSA